MTRAPVIKRGLIQTPGPLRALFMWVSPFISRKSQRSTALNIDPIDYTGRVIKVGDLVAYPVRRGSEMWLSAARVISIRLRSKNKHGAEHTIEAQSIRQRVVLLHTARLMVVEESETTERGGSCVRGTQQTRSEERRVG